MGWCSAATSATRAVVPLRHPARLQQQAAPRGLGPLRTAVRAGHPPRARGRARGDRATGQRARGIHSRQRVRARRERGARAVRRGRVLRARHRRRGRDRPRDGGVDRRRRTQLRHLEDGHPPVRRPVPVARVRAGRAPSRCTRPTTTSTTRTRSAPRAARCADRRRTSASPRSVARSARRAAGSGRTGSSRTRRAATRRCARGWAGEHWSPAIGAEARACRDSAVLFDETSFSKLELEREGCRRLPRPRLRERDGPAGRLGDLHPALQRAGRHRVRPHGDPARAGPLLRRHRYRVRQPRPRLGPQAAGTPRRGRRGRGA